MPPKKRPRLGGAATAKAPGIRAAAAPAGPPPPFQRLPEATRKSLQALLRPQKFGEEDSGAPQGEAAAGGDPVVGVLARNIPLTSPFAWLDPENLQLPACWKDPLTGPAEACCLLLRQTELLPALGKTAAIATSENCLVALEATVLRHARRGSSGDTAVVLADAQLAGETQEALVQAATRHGGDWEALRGALEALWPHVLPHVKTMHYKGQRRVTTRYRLWQDQRLKQYLVDRPGGHFVLPTFEITGTDEQRLVAQAVFTHLRRNGWSVLSGPGGAGKTYLLGQLATTLRSARVPNEHAMTVRCPLCDSPFTDRCLSCNFQRPRGRDRPVSVALTAPTNRAVAVLRRVVEDFGGNIVCYTLHALAKASQALPIDVLVVDEASMLAAEHGDLILQIPSLRRACVLLVGDAAQLPPVGGGELLRPLLSAGGLPCLSANMRAEALLAEPLQRVRSGDAAGMADYATVCPDDASRHAAVFAAAGDAGGARIVLAPLNDDRIGYCRYAMRRLAPREDARDDYISGRASPRLFVPFVGMPVRFQNNSLKPAACSGMLGEIVASAEGAAGSFSVSVQVHTPEGPRGVELEGSLARLAYHLRPAYAVTVHDSQGGEFDRVDVLLPSSATCPLCNQELLYTAVSRARHAIAIWTVRTGYAAFVPRLSQASAERVTPLRGLLSAELRRRGARDPLEEEGGED